MAQGNAHRVRRVVGLGNGGQLQKPLGHILNLMLGGVAVAHHRLLDLHGLVLKNRHSRLPDSQQNHAPALSHVDARSHIVAEKQLFDGHRLGLRHPQKLRHVVVDHFQPPGKIRIGRRGNGPAVEHFVLPPIRFDQAEARNAVARVDSQNPHYRPPLATTQSCQITNRINSARPILAPQTCQAGRGS